MGGWDFNIQSILVSHDEDQSINQLIKKKPFFINARNLSFFSAFGDTARYRSISVFGDTAVQSKKPVTVDAKKNRRSDKKILDALILDAVLYHAFCLVLGFSLDA